MTGLHLSHYAIEAELGRGGMGIVFRAKDTKLNRTVALKVLPAGALASQDDRARFRREAQAAAQINHANVCHVYQVDEAQPLTSDGKPVEGQAEPRLFIAMEYIEGQTLHDYVKQGPLKLQEAVNIAGQVAEALKVAHAKDIVHRDIKSANIMLTEGGVAKVLDFGLAKTNQSTMLTRMGSTLGTVAYMSPEQARGQEVDGRSDLYSLGTVLYEMIAGRLPYSGDYEQAVIYGILNEPPEPLTAVRTGVPMQLEWIVNKLLAKDADHRYQSAAGLLADLKSLDLSGSGRTMPSMPAVSAAAGPATSARAAPRWIWGAIAGALIFGAVAAWVIKPASAVKRDTAVRQLTMALDGMQINWFDVSPDSRTLAVQGEDALGTTGIFLIDVEDGARRHLVGGGAERPVFSPDGARIQFFETGSLFTLPVSGGTPLEVAVDARLGAWLPDGSLLYGAEDVIWMKPGSGGPPQELTSLDSLEVQHDFPTALPDGSGVLFQSTSELGRYQMFAVDLKTGQRTDLGPGSHPKYLDSGHLLHGTAESQWGGPLMAQPFDVQRLAFSGPATAVAANAPPQRYAVDPAGTLYSRFPASNDFSEYRLIPERPGGERLPALLKGDFDEPRVSPSGDRIAVIDQSDGARSLAILNLTSGVLRPVTASGRVRSVAWSADGTELLVNRDEVFEIWSSGTGGLLRTLDTQASGNLDWSPDGRRIVYVNALNRGTLRLLDLETGVDTLFEARDATQPRFSPDGKNIAYAVGEAAGLQVYIASVDGLQSGRVSIEVDLHRKPMWSRTSSTLFVEGANRGIHSIYRVPMDASGLVQVGPGEVVHEPWMFIDEWDLGPDDTMYLVGMPLSDDGFAGSTVLDVTVNWFEKLKRLAPPSK